MVRPQETEDLRMCMMECGRNDMNIMGAGLLGIISKGMIIKILLKLIELW